jgi:hypothetical protein
MERIADPENKAASPLTIALMSGSRFMERSKRGEA